MTELAVGTRIHISRPMNFWYCSAEEIVAGARSVFQPKDVAAKVLVSPKDRVVLCKNRLGSTLLLLQLVGRDYYLWVAPGDPFTVISPLELLAECAKE